MRQCGAQQLKPGMVLARPIYDQHYRKLLSEGVSLNATSIRRILDLGFRFVFIKEAGTENIRVEDLIGIKCRKEASEALHQLAEHEKKKRQISTNPFRVNQPSTSFTVKHQQLVQRAVSSIIGELTFSRHPVYFPGVYLAKDQLINHSTDVAILSLLIGLGFGFTNKDLHLLGKAALFHDVGKLRLDPELSATHPLDLTEEQLDLYHMHPQMGAVLLEQDVTNDIQITMAVLQHHEHQDGSGFPEKLNGNGEPPTSKVRSRGGIHRYAEIISVANYFDNLVSGLVERDPVFPHEAVQRILEKTPSWFNSHVVQMALTMINVFPVGTPVQISDSRHYSLVGYRGVVAKTNVENLHRPMITLIFDPRHNRLEEPKTVDFREDNRLKLEFLYDL